MIITGPTWLYHKTQPPRIIATQAEYDALGPGWVDTPAIFTVEVRPETPSVMLSALESTLRPTVKRRGRPRPPCPSP